ncbi:uncharacterized protein LOC114575713 [Exaiptasia diaphana]|uniref:RING-type domain-containing protein n=1 Tax=Exaiptasia diaphana TaxID=2652724 RepID=A0A913YPH8_EXADI|nr:uncharacterized protein LOC114575713 [Exaiptasia diaphana]KXJ25196.1 E3 ubiquitin-protein ligase SH3RF1 [Exaiptasia diaphana]
MDSPPKAKYLKLSLSDEELRCPLCFELLLGEPKILPKCAHTFCKDCVTKMISQKDLRELVCPVCRKVSSVPQNVDDLATNNLILRLIDGVPGLRETEDINESLALCKVEIDKANTIQGHIGERMKLLKENVEKLAEVKHEISACAEEMISLIRGCEESLNSEVDAFLDQNCAKMAENLEKYKNNLSTRIEKTLDCMKTVKDTLDRNDVEEIVKIKKVIADHLKEFSSYLKVSSSSIEKVGQVKTLEFQKQSYKDMILGKIEEVVATTSTTIDRTTSCNAESAVNTTVAHNHVVSVPTASDPLNAPCTLNQTTSSNVQSAATASAGLCNSQSKNTVSAAKESAGLSNISNSNAVSAGTAPAGHSNTSSDNAVSATKTSACLSNTSNSKTVSTGTAPSGASASADTTSSNAVSNSRAQSKRSSKVSPPKHPTPPKWIMEENSLSFHPDRIAAEVNGHYCSESDMLIGVLWSDGREIALFRGDEHKNSIMVKFGIITDIAFWNNMVAAVNRQRNRVLFYEKCGQFINIELNNPENVKFTYVSVDKKERLIITSTRTDEDDKDAVIHPKIIVYEKTDGNYTMNFGSRYLTQPVSRALYAEGRFYIADKCQGKIRILGFTSSGDSCFSSDIVSNSLPLSVSLSTNGYKHSRVILHETHQNGTLLKMVEDNGNILTKAQQITPYQKLKQALVIFTKQSSTVQAEIYCDRNRFTIVQYSC